MPELFDYIKEVFQPLKIKCRVKDCKNEVKRVGEYCDECGDEMFGNERGKDEQIHSSDESKNGE